MLTPSANATWMVCEPRNHGLYGRNPPVEVDPLTGALSRDRMEAILYSMVTTAAEAGAVFSLALFDVDRFACVNVRHGRERGDEVLRQLAQVMRALLREEDRLARWDGDEFLLLAPDTDLRQSLRLAEGIRARVSSRAFNGIDHISLSVGVACWKSGDTLTTLLQRLESRQATARNSGRNQVCASD